MDKKNFHWKYLLLPAVVIVFVLLVFFWDTVFLHIAPKAVLSQSLKAAYTDLEYRFTDHPLGILCKTIDAEGKYTANVKLKTENKLLGSITYDMKVLTDSLGHRIHAEGNATASQTNIHLSCYLDEQFLAVRSKNLSKNTFYGITFDTFSEDLRSIPLLDFFISEKLINQWNTSLHGIRQQISKDYILSPTPILTKDDLKTLTLGILALPCKIETCSIPFDTGSLECHSATYTLHGDQIRQILANTPYSQDPHLTVTFYLYEQKLVKIYLQCSAGDNRMNCSLFLGTSPAEDVLQLQVQQKHGNDVQQFLVKVDTNRSENQYSENWSISQTEGELRKDTQYSFDYQISNGELNLLMDQKMIFSGRFIESENGFLLESETFQDTLNSIMLDKELTIPLSGTITVSKGSYFDTPSYKNLNAWSLEDFWALLSGIGSLLGIEIQ